MLNEQGPQAHSVKPSKRICNMEDLMNALKRGRESGETHGWLSLEDFSMDTCERELVVADICRKLAEAEKQVADGDLLDADEALARLRQKYGF